MMNRFVSKFLLLFFLCNIIALTTSCTDDGPVFQVNDVVSDPGAYSGTLTIEGVVYTFAKSDASIVGIMDKKELLCKTPNCKKTLLAVKIETQRPEVGDEVKITGSLIKENWGYMLKAEKVKITNNHNLGGTP